VSFLGRVWRGWLVVAQKAGNFQVRVIFSLFYFVLVAPVALGVKAFFDPLGIRRRSNTFWRPRERVTGPRTIEEARQHH